MTERLNWPPIVERAREIVGSYDTPVTLRQLFYRLVSEGLIPNGPKAFATLSDRTAKARRAETFPDLSDSSRSIVENPTFPSPEEAVAWVARIYRRDRTEGQPWSLYVGVEKHALAAQLQQWFGDLGVPILALRGYASQSFVDEVRRHAEVRRRPAVLVYAGDFDPSGEDIDRDFVARTDCWARVVRVAPAWERVEAFGLPPQMGKADDSRAADLVARHGELIQVELDAVPPDDLRRLYAEAIAEHFDRDTYDVSVAQEQQERAALTRRPATAPAPEGVGGYPPSAGVPPAPGDPATAPSPGLPPGPGSLGPLPRGARLKAVCSPRRTSEG